MAVVSQVVPWGVALEDGGSLVAGLGFPFMQHFAVDPHAVDEARSVHAGARSQSLRIVHTSPAIRSLRKIRPSTGTPTGERDVMCERPCGAAPRLSLVEPRPGAWSLDEARAVPLLRQCLTARVDPTPVWQSVGSGDDHRRRRRLTAHQGPLSRRLATAHNVLLDWSEP